MDDCPVRGASRPGRDYSNQGGIEMKGRLNSFAAIGSMLLVTSAYLGLKVLSVCPWTLDHLPLWLDRNWWLVTVSDVLSLAIMICMTSMCLRLTKLTWSDLGWRPRLSFREASWGLASGLAVHGAISYYQSVAGQTPMYAEASVKALTGPSVRAWAQLVFSVALVAGVQEELVYRGAIVGFLRRAFGGGVIAAAIAAFVSGLVFSALHGLKLSAYPLYWGIGVFLALVYMHTESLPVVIVAHIVANAIPTLQGLWDAALQHFH